MKPTTNLDPLGVLASQGKNAVESRVDNIHVGVCPICRETMKVTKINISGSTVDAYACFNDRVCMPVQNAPMLELY